MLRRRYRNRDGKCRIVGVWSQWSNADKKMMQNGCLAIRELQHQVEFWAQTEKCFLIKKEFGLVEEEAVCRMQYHKSYPNCSFLCVSGPLQSAKRPWTILSNRYIKHVFITGYGFLHHDISLDTKPSTFESLLQTILLHSQVRAASVCKDFQGYGDLCGWDARLLRLGAQRNNHTICGGQNHSVDSVPSDERSQCQAFCAGCVLRRCNVLC